MLLLMLLMMLLMVMLQFMLELAYNYDCHHVDEVCTSFNADIVDNKHIHFMVVCIKTN